jgi:hypothetical protein
LISPIQSSSSSEHRHPAPDRFVGDVDTAFGEQLFEIPKAQGEAKIEPDRVLDDPQAGSDSPA